MKKSYKKKKLFEPLKYTFRVNSLVNKSDFTPSTSLSGAIQYNLVLGQFQSSGTLTGPMIRLNASNVVITSNNDYKANVHVKYNLLCIGGSENVLDDGSSLLNPTPTLVPQGGLSSNKVITYGNFTYPDIGKRLWASNTGILSTTKFTSPTLRFEDHISSKRVVERYDQLVLTITLVAIGTTGVPLTAFPDSAVIDISFQIIDFLNTN